MNLEITSYNNRFQIKGHLNSRNLSTFNAHFVNVFDRVDEILLDIEKVESVDRSGVMALARLHNEAIVKSKRLSILGLGCKELYKFFKSEEPKVETSNQNVLATKEIVAA